jgi:hypothetical protein
MAAGWPPGSAALVSEMTAITLRLAVGRPIADMVLIAAAAASGGDRAVCGPSR